MPVLATTGFEIPFDEISSIETEKLPEIIRPAADLIRRWYHREESFYLKTSGSTGEPKSFQLIRQRIKLSAMLTRQAMGLESGDWVLNCLSTDHVAGLMMVMRAFVCDFNLFVVPPSSNPLKDVPEEQPIDFASFVPLQMRKMLDTGMTSRLEDIGAILLGGGPVSSALETRIKQLHTLVYQGYGMTETYSHVALRKVNGPDASEKYRPLQGVKINLDERGCLVIRAEVTGNEAVVTNDLAKIFASGEFEWLGRIDNVINTGGVKVQAEKVETETGAALAELGKDALSYFAAGIPSERLGQKIVLIVEDKDWGMDMSTSLMEKLSDYLSKYEMPKELYFVKEFNRTTLGKIDRKKVITTILGHENK
jgi:O-succinylbenzoic acid--CoA ligase